MKHNGKAVEIHEYLADEGITSSRVLAAIRAVQRDRFIPRSQRDHATGNYPLPIGHGQTISQPYIVAYMTQELDVRRGDRVLEIGTGSGYQTAILAEMTPHVFTVETIRPLADAARARLDNLGYTDVRALVGNGYDGWGDEAPFNRIIVTAAASHVPPPLIDQLAPDGRMIIPIGPAGGVQHLVMVTKTGGGRLREEKLLAVRFVPFTGEP